MNKRELIQEAVTTLKLKGVTKRVPFQKHTFTISDEDGNARNFTVQRSDKDVPYEFSDVAVAFDTVLEVLFEAMRRGEECRLKDFGSFELRFVPESTCHHVRTRQLITIPAHYKIRFKPGSKMMSAAKTYSLVAAEEAKRIGKEQAILDAISPYSEGEDDDVVCN